MKRNDDNQNMKKQDLLKLLKKYWGYTSFRSAQLEIIQSILHGHDTIGLLPTSGGKSLCYQIPALAGEGVCIVISPLIALMQDQVSDLKKRGISAELLSSDLSYRDIDRILDNAVYGHVKLLYTSPERLSTELFIERLKRMKVSLLAVDEAHCISMWGHDFRPAYLHIDSIQSLLQVPTLAVTATATQQTLKDIEERLKLSSPTIIKRSFYRENLHLQVKTLHNPIKRFKEFCRQKEGLIIAYVNTRKKSEILQQQFQNEPFVAKAFHAGLAAEEKTSLLKQWMNNEIKVIIATTAFGMGIDKSDVRYVVHLDVPANLEEYYQQAGRAGRDGNTAYCSILLDANSEIQERSMYPKKEEIEVFYNRLMDTLNLAIGSLPQEPLLFPINKFLNKYAYSYPKIVSILGLLEKYNVLSTTDFEKPKIEVLINRTSLQKLKKQHPNWYVFIGAILRTHENVTLDAVSLHTQRLSKMLKLSSLELDEKLEKAEKMGWIQYSAFSNDLKLNIQVPRLQTKSLPIIWSELAQLKKIHKQKRKELLKYLQDDGHCRNRKMLLYFGENLSQDCGVCDVCLRKNKTASASLDAQILNLLSSPKTIFELNNHLNATRNDINQIVRQLMDQQRIKKVENKYVLK